VAALFFTHLGNDWITETTMENLKNTMIKTLKDVLELIDNSIQGSDDEVIPHSSLNFAVTDGCQVLASRFSSVSEYEPPSLYYSTKAGPTLNRKFPDHPDGKETNDKNKKSADEHGKHAIVASEPNTYKSDEWELVPPNSFVLIDKNFNVTTEQIQL